LISSTTGKYLLEDYSLAVSPSSSLLVILSEIAGRKGVSRDERLLSVGNPSFDRDNFPSLSDLPSAAAEAEKVAAYYRPADLLVGSNATLERVTSEMSKSDVIHFAVHAVADGRSPAHSRLVLAKDSKTSDGSLQADDIYQMKLGRTRLAVLSACQTGAERYYGGEGMVSLARPFLAAGIPLVIVSFWPVDSDATAELMVNFHKHRKQDKLSSVEALRRAQLEMLNSPNERFHAPFFWGAFASIGGFTSF
jgi:CHAT domain-containing protein